VRPFGTLWSPIASLGRLLGEKNVSGYVGWFTGIDPVFKLVSSYRSRVGLGFQPINPNRMDQSSATPLANPSGLQLALIHPTAAGLDVGSMAMMVSYQDQGGQQRLTETLAYTQDIEALAGELQAAGVTQVALEATGVYWMAVYEILESYGLTLTLVNAGHYKNVAAQKTDVKDAQWLQQLHAYGLLRPSHIADEWSRELRTYLHERGVMQDQKKDTLNRIQKVLTQMNVKVQHLLSDIEGVVGMQLLRRIAAGMQSPETLLEGLPLKQLKASPADLVKSLQGRYKPQYVTVLQHQLASYDFYQSQMNDYEQLIEAVLQKMLPAQGEGGNAPVIEKKNTKARKNQYHFNLKGYLTQIAGTDLTAVDGLDEITVLQIIAVTGLDMSKWKTAEHFVSWLNLSPRVKKSGGKVLGHQQRFTHNAATQAFRLAAQTMWQSKSRLGSLYRRLSARKGSKKAIKAVARRLAVIFYHMLTNKTSYDPAKVAIDEEKQKAQKIARLQKEAEKLGCRLEVAA
jgi:transposase